MSETIYDLLRDYIERRDIQGVIRLLRYLEDVDFEDKKQALIWFLNQIGEPLKREYVDALRR